METFITFIITSNGYVLLLSIFEYVGDGWLFKYRECLLRANTDKAGFDCHMDFESPRLATSKKKLPLG